MNTLTLTTDEQYREYLRIYKPVLSKKTTRYDYKELPFYRSLASKVTDEEFAAFLEKHKNAQPMEVGSYVTDQSGYSRIAIVKRDSEFWTKAYIGYARHYIHHDDESQYLWKYRLVSPIYDNQLPPLAKPPDPIWYNGNWLHKAF